MHTYDLLINKQRTHSERQRERDWFLYHIVATAHYGLYGRMMTATHKFKISTVSLISPMTTQQPVSPGAACSRPRAGCWHSCLTPLYGLPVASAPRKLVTGIARAAGPAAGTECALPVGRQDNASSHDNVSNQWTRAGPPSQPAPGNPPPTHVDWQAGTSSTTPVGNTFDAPSHR